MTFLELCQATARECGISGTVPTTVASQTGELNRIVQWVKDAYTEIQNRHKNWLWLRSEFTFGTTADDDTYGYLDLTDVSDAAAISRFSHWLIHDPEWPAKSYLTSTGVSGEGFLTFMEWNHFRRVYKVGTQTSGQPAWITVDPRQNLVLGPAPSAAYTITGDYQQSAQLMSADGNIPEMPTHFHMLIVYYAMQKYAGFDAANEIMIRAVNEGGRLMRQLENNQLPQLRFAAPMA